VRPVTRPWAALAQAIDGDVLLHGSADHERHSPVFNARFDDLRPEAIVRCATPEDVAETIRFLARHGLAHAIRSGGHSFADHSSTQGVLVDVGSIGRTHGATSDQVLGAQIVLADGRIVDCDDHREPDLFWALRGAGAGSFGVVTALELATVPAPAATSFRLAWPPASAAAVVDAWQHWAPSGPDELAASLKVTSDGDPDTPPSVDLYGTIFGPPSDAADSRTPRRHFSLHTHTVHP
jgi:FAD/FMN-containing dehydrogenase